MTEKDDLEYAKGEVLVLFGTPDYIEKISPEKFAEFLGYKYIGDWNLDESGEITIFKVPEGKEKEAIKKIESHKDVVQWAAQRCITYEKRVLNLEKIVEVLNDVIDEAGELSKKQYNKKIDEIIGYFQKDKE